MGYKEEVLIRTTIAVVLGFTLNALMSSLSSDVVTPILKQKSFDEEEKRLVFKVGSVRIYFGNVLGHLVTVALILISTYAVLSVLEKRKIL